MIDDMASLKQAMEQMDADDAAVAQAAKDRAAQILSEARLSFSKMAELIEQRRLLLRPRIVASIKRMDQPSMLGDTAFRDASASLRKEGQSFYHIAEALELNGGPALRYNEPPRYNEPGQRGELLHPLEMKGETVAPARLRALTFAARIVLYPLQHPIRFLAIAVIVFMLVNTFRGFVGTGRQISGYVADVSAARQRADAAVASVRSFFERRTMRSSQDAAAPPTAPAPVPSSPSPADSPPSATPPTGTATASPPPAPTATAAAPPATGAAPPANEAAPPTASTAAPARPAAATPDVEAKAAPAAKPATNDRSRVAHMPALGDMMPERLHRNSRTAGPCIGGVGGCYWGGVRY